VLDPELLSGLEEAVEAAPENRKLHLHLIALLLSGGLSDRALGHAQWLLLYEPDNKDALMLAAQAADALEDEDRADRYRRVADALTRLGQEA
jgi:Flp pilus assembly protein TadD